MTGEEQHEHTFALDSMGSITCWCGEVLDDEVDDRPGKQRICQECGETFWSRGEQRICLSCQDELGIHEEEELDG